MGRCALLDWAVAFQASGQPIGQNLFAKTDDQTGFSIADLAPVLLPIGYRQLASRFALIDAFLNNDEDLGSAITDVVLATTAAWDYQPSAAVNQEVVSEPSFVQSLESAPNLIGFLRKSAERHGGWSHPGILLAGETLAALNGDRRTAEANSRTKILFAYKQPKRARGILGEITIERISDGAGLLVPNAYSCGYLWMKRSFSDGLQNALWAARNHAKQHFGDGICNFDWRWTIDLRAATDRIPVLKREPQIELEGHSAEVALACAMIATHPNNKDLQRNQDPLDPHVGVTARIADPGNDAHDAIAGVSSVDVKTLVERMETRRLWEVVIAESQDPSQIPRNDQRFRFPAARTLREAYELMVRNRRITTGVNRFLALEAGRLKREHCQPYILPAIAERTRQPESAEQPGATETPLSDEAIEHLLKGRLYATETEVPPDVSNPWVGNRVRIFADSGLGKSVFILHLQRQIAKSNDDLLPIRLGRVTGEDSDLGEIDWTIGRDQILGRLAGSRGLTEAIDRWCQSQGHEQLDAEERERWFGWMIRTGRVVFLFDALDQTAREVLSLGNFLAQPEIRSCPAILTGRPSSVNSHAFRDNAWRTLRLLPFDWERQRRYLGEDLSSFLQLPKHKTQEELPLGSLSVEENEKLKWRDLLEIPLLIGLMKQLAIEAGSGLRFRIIHSRKELYDQAVTHLIRKGWNSLESSSKGSLLVSESKIRFWLGRIAFRMIRRSDRHDFTGVIDGDEFERLVTDNEIGEDAMKVLEKIDVTTVHQLLESVGRTGLAFRHRSFMEYFAAWYLVSGKVDENEDLESVRKDFVLPIAREKLLHEIHDVIDAHGNWLSHMQDPETSNRPSQWNETLRFALAHAENQQWQQFAKQLIELGNPWVVFQSLNEDRSASEKLIDFTSIDALTTWLVHRDESEWFSGKLARIELERRESIRSTACGAVERKRIRSSELMKIEHRDAAVLSPLRAISGMSDSFYQSESKHSVSLQKLNELCWPGTKSRVMNSFVSVTGGDFDISNYDYRRDNPQSMSRKYGSLFAGMLAKVSDPAFELFTDECDSLVPTSPIPITDFELADFPVTNHLFELFCPTHRRHRGPYSSADDQPVLHVSWFIANEFCEWLSELSGLRYRLPSEWEWEWACRWYNTLQGPYWWGEFLSEDLCHCRGDDSSTTHAQRTRGRKEAINTYGEIPYWHPSREPNANAGLLDMLGNVWEWCQNRRDSVGKFKCDDRIIRGGAWDLSYRSSRCSQQSSYLPETRTDNVSFRLCREPN